MARGEILPEWSPARVIARLEARREGLEAGQRSLIAFDGDGTLWSGDIGDELFEGLLARRAIRREAQAELEAEAGRFEVVAPTPDPHDVAAALFAAYRAGRYPEDRAFAMMAWALAGHTEGEALALAAAVLEQRPVVGRIHEGVAPLLAWAADRGVEAWIVSASPRPMVLAAAAEIGVEPSRVIAMTPALDGDRLAPRIAGEIVYGEGKRRALAAARPGAAWLAVFGDSGWDVSMMVHAEVQVAIDPKPSLLARRAEVPELVRLAGLHVAGRCAPGS